MPYDEIDAYMNELLEKGAYRVDGVDPETGELLLVVVPEVMEEVDPNLFEIYRLDADLELERTLTGLEEKGLIVRSLNEYGEEVFDLSPEARKAIGE